MLSGSTSTHPISVGHRDRNPQQSHGYCPLWWWTAGQLHFKNMMTTYPKTGMVSTYGSSNQESCGHFMTYQEPIVCMYGISIYLHLPLKNTNTNLVIWYTINEFSGYIASNKWFLHDKLSKMGDLAVEVPLIASGNLIHRLLHLDDKSM